jgi:hypothetical protein
MLLALFLRQQGPSAGQQKVSRSARNARVVRDLLAEHRCCTD